MGWLTNNQNQDAKTKANNKANAKDDKKNERKNHKKDRGRQGHQVKSWSLFADDEENEETGGWFG